MLSDCETNKKYKTVKLKKYKIQTQEKVYHCKFKRLIIVYILDYHHLIQIILSLSQFNPPIKTLKPK